MSNDGLTDDYWRQLTQEEAEEVRRNIRNAEIKEQAWILEGLTGAEQVAFCGDGDSESPLLGCTLDEIFEPPKPTSK